MDFKQLQEEFRKLEDEAGEKSASALIGIMEIRSTLFEEKLEEFKKSQEKSDSLTRWAMGIGFSVLAVLMVLLKLF